MLTLSWAVAMDGIADCKSCFDFHNFLFCFSEYFTLPRPFVVELA